MGDLDYSLILLVQQVNTGANVHHARTWLFLYEKSPIASSDRRIYEYLLRSFVAAAGNLSTMRNTFLSQVEKKLQESRTFAASIESFLNKRSKK